MLWGDIVFYERTDENERKTYCSLSAGADCRRARHIFLVRGAQSSGAFRGSCVKNSDSYTLDIENMNGTDGHTLELRQGDTLQIHFAVEKGSIRLSIIAPDGTELYAGNGTEATDFTVNISADGVYAISVEARQARGTIQISVAG